MDEQEKFEGWAIVELMGHRRLGGFVTETQLAGAGMLRIDIPADDGKGITQFFPPTSLYGLTPVTEEMARAVARHNIPQPVHRWELPAAADPEARAGDDDPDDLDGHGREDEDAIF